MKPILDIRMYRFPPVVGAMRDGRGFPLRSFEAVRAIAQGTRNGIWRFQAEVRICSRKGAKKRGIPRKKPSAMVRPRLSEKYKSYQMPRRGLPVPVEKATREGIRQSAVVQSFTPALGSRPKQG